MVTTVFTSGNCSLFPRRPLILFLPSSLFFTLLLPFQAFPAYFLRSRLGRPSAVFGSDFPRAYTLGPVLRELVLSGYRSGFGVRGVYPGLRKCLYRGSNIGLLRGSRSFCGPRQILVGLWGLVWIWASSRG